MPGAPAARSCRGMRPRALAGPLGGLLALALAAAPAAAALAWSEPQTIPDTSWGGPIAAGVDAAGNALVVQGRPQDVQVLERPAGGAWTRSATFLASPRGPLPEGAPGLAAVAGDGAAAVVWRIGRDPRKQQVRALVRDPGGGPWHELAVSRLPANGVAEPRIAIDARGDVLAVWRAGFSWSGAGSHHVVAAHRRAGGSFGRPRRLSAAGAGAPALAMSPDGHAVIAWRSGSRIEAVDVDRGRFSTVRRIGPAGRFPESDRATHGPSVAVGRGGGAVIAYVDILPDPEDRSGVVDTRPYVVRAARRARRGHFGPAATQRRFSPGERLAVSDPITAAGPDGRVAAAWLEETPDHEVSTLRGVYGRRGTRFGRPARLSARERGYASGPVIAFAHDGTLVAGWLWHHIAVGPGTTPIGVQIARGTGTRLAAPTTFRLGDYPTASSLHIGVDRRGAVTAFWVDTIGRQPITSVFTVTGTPPA